MYSSNQPQQQISVQINHNKPYSDPPVPHRQINEKRYTEKQGADWAKAQIKNENEITEKKITRKGQLQNTEDETGGWTSKQID